MFIRNFFVLAVTILVSSVSLANPDVFFVDSAEHQDAHLINEFNGDNIKFKMSNEAALVENSAHDYNLDALVNFTKNTYQFANQALKPEFGYMFHTSFRSNYTSQVFLTELKRLLEQFAEQYPGHVY